MKARRFLFVLAAAAILTPIPAQAPASAAKTKPGAASTKQAATRDILARGAEMAKGLPGFGINALPGLRGEYRSEGSDAEQDRILVWMSREALFIAPKDWERMKAGDRDAYAFIRPEAAGYGVPEAGGRLILFDRPFTANGQGAEPRQWSVLVYMPEGRKAETDRFIDAFLNRLSYFLSNAKSPEEASFPAVLER